MKLSFLLDSAEGAGCLCRMTAQDGTATLSLTPPVYDGRPHDTAALEGCYETALDAALSSGCGSVAIPTLGAWGGWPPQFAVPVALVAVDRVAQALDLYVSGSLNVFNHKTNVDIHNRLVAFDIKELGKQLKKLGMLIIQDQIWGRVTQNRSQGRATWYFADEFHLLLKEEQTAAYSAEIWKRFRKWGGVPTGATQNVKDLLSSPEIENILENSDFITLLNQASGDRKILSERLNLSADQQKYIDNSEPGEGLLIFENVVLPFSNPIPKNTQLYKIMTTRLSEVVEL